MDHVIGLGAVVGVGCLVLGRVYAKHQRMRAPRALRYEGDGDFVGVELDRTRYVDLLGKLIREAKHVQNYPPELIPNEDKVVHHVVEALKPFTTENGGVLTLEKISYEPGRSNLIITYPGSNGGGGRNIGLIGSHLDVVPAYPDSWDRNPFELVVEGDQLYGRGTTDCLGHVALVTCFFQELAKKKPQLKSDVVAVFIASEENEDKPGVGVDGLVKNGRLDHLKSGVCLWIDASDSEPCQGTAGAIQWHLKATGKRFHSGFPHKTVNPIELVSDALTRIQRRFYEDFGEHPDEKRYQFATSSTMKPTQMKCADGSLNQIPPHATISGDIRVTPFYSCRDVIKRVKQYVDELNQERFASIQTKNRGPYSKYDLPAENLRGKLEMTFGESESMMDGIACNLDSPGFHALCDALQIVRGSVKPYSICGSLPLVREMSDAGFDLQITGFGKSATYHAENEYCLLSDMMEAGKVLSNFVSICDKELNK